MEIEELLLPEEKKKIKNITETQKSILERREALKIILNWWSIQKKVKLNKSDINNANAYRKFLEDEWFFKKEIVKEKNKWVFIEWIKTNKNFQSMCSEVYLYTNGIYWELINSLSNINKIEKIISWLWLIEKKLVLCKECKELDYIIKDRYKSLMYNISKVIKLLGDSKWDIVDYYSNKADILKLLKTIVNSSKNLINTL